MHRRPPQAQAMPTRHQTQCIGGFQNKGVQALKAAPAQLVSGLGKTTIRDATRPVTILGQAAKEGVEQDLLGRPAHGQQRTNQLWQRKLAIAGEGFGKVKMPRIGGELRRVNALGELGEKSIKG